MSSLETRKIEPTTGTTVTLGAGGDTVLVSADQLKTNTVKDAGGNTLFTSDGAGILSSVNSAFVGSMTFISSQTASSSTSVSFTTGIDSTYDEYVFYFVNISTSGNNMMFNFQVNADGQSGYNETITSTCFVARHTESDSAANLAYDGGPAQSQGTGFQPFMTSIESGADASGAGVLHLFGPSSTTYVKHFYSTTSSLTYHPAEYTLFIGGYINTTNAIDEIQFKVDSGTFDGTIAMYGIT